MKRLLLAIVLSLATAFGALAQVSNSAGGMVPNAPPATPTGSLPFTPVKIINVVDYGAKCDSATNDDSAINAAFTAARAALSLGNNISVSIEFPTSKRCLVSSINSTGFTNGTTTINCHGTTMYGRQASVPVFDGLGSIGVRMTDCGILSSSDIEPTYGIQIGRLDTTANNNGGSGWIFQNLNVTGSFSIAACYNFAGETVLYTNPVCANSDTSASSYSFVQDGINHFNITSAFVTELAPVDAPQSFNANTIVNGHFKSLGGASNVSAVWSSDTRSHSYVNTYALNNGGANCVTLYEIASGASQLSYWDVHCEGAAISNIFLVAGTLASPVYNGFTYKDGAIFASSSIFSLSGSAVSAAIQSIDLNVSQSLTAVNNTVTVFASAKAWTVSGKVYLANPSWWNAPLTFNGQLFLGTLFNRPQLGPVDILSQAGCSVSMAYSAARQLSQSYKGPLIDVGNTAGTITGSIYPTSNGDLDLSAVSVLLPGVTRNVSTLYDQSGNANNMTDATLISQPSLTLSDAVLGARPAMQFGDAGAAGLSVAASSSTNGIFTAGGFMIAVVNQTGNPTTTDRIVNKTSAIWQYNSAAGIQFQQGAATTTGGWQIALPATGGHVLDMRYSASSVANVPTMATDGTTGTLTSTTQPVGAITADSGTVTLGNNVVPAGARGFPGNIAELIVAKCTPAANGLESVRRNMANYYGLSAVN